MTLVWDFVHIPHTLFHRVKMCCVGAIPAGASAWPPGPSSHTAASLSAHSGGPTQNPCARPTGLAQ